MGRDLGKGASGMSEPPEVVMHPDLPFTVSGPYVVQSTWSPTGLLSD